MIKAIMLGIATFLFVGIVGFADASGKKLNLITCGGTFDKETKNYSKRTVVYTELVD